MAFWINDRANSSAVTEGIYMFMGVMAGEIIPLNIMFNGNLEFLAFNPFAWSLHLPMQVYLGKFNHLQVGLVILGGVVWSFVLYLFAKIVFNIGLKKNESVGL